MKIAFLDIDGVMNNEATKFGRKFDPECVRALNFITDLTGAGIVVSSTWRNAGLPEIRSILSENGVTGKVYGLTPDLSKKQVVYISTERGLEIQAWLDKRLSVKHFVILDDADDMAHLKDQLIQTESRIGLTLPLAELAVKILNR